MSKYESSECKCQECVGYCLKRPCWPKPEEAEALINKGYAERLMLDYWVGDASDGSDIEIVSPAIVGYEGLPAPFWPQGMCTFLSADNLCELHSLGLKPFEGRVAICNKESPTLHEDSAYAWNNNKGRMVVLAWRKACCPDDIEENENGVQQRKVAMVENFM